MIKTGHKRSVSSYEAEIKRQFWIEKFPNKSWTESELALFSPPLFLPEIHKVVHVEFIRQSETLKAQFYCNNLRHLKENIQQKQPKPTHAKVPLCATTQSIENTWPQQHNYCSPPAPLLGFGYMWVPSIPQNENQVQGSMFWCTGGDPACIADALVKWERTEQFKNITHTGSRRDLFINISLSSVLNLRTFWLYLVF